MAFLDGLQHYSSARNVQGPHTGLPCIVEEQPPPTESGESTAQTAANGSPSAASSSATAASQEESLVLSSLRYPHRHSVLEIRKLIHDNGGSWERALETLLESEIDETESEDFNPSPQPPHTPLPSIGVTAATPGRGTAGAVFDQQQQQQHQTSSTLPRTQHTQQPNRPSSPSTSSSTATSATTNQSSQSTTATQLSDIAADKDSIEPPTSTHISSNPYQGEQLPRNKVASMSPSIPSRVRSRAGSPDPEISAAESPRQRFRISRDSLDRGEDSSSFGGDDIATFDGSSVTSNSSAAGSLEDMPDTASSAAPTPPPGARPPQQQQQQLTPVKSSRFPKRKETLVAMHNKPPTRRQRKQ